MRIQAVWKVVDHLHSIGITGAGAASNTLGRGEFRVDRFNYVCIDSDGSVSLFDLRDGPTNVRHGRRIGQVDTATRNWHPRVAELVKDALMAPTGVVWTTVPGFPRIEATREGQLRKRGGGRKPRLLKPYAKNKQNRGHLYITYYYTKRKRRSISAASLVLRTFAKYDPDRRVFYRDRNPKNLAVTNLYQG